MRIILLGDSFVPSSSSVAVQLRDFAVECVRQGHDLTLVVPSRLEKSHWKLQNYDGYRVLKLNALLKRDGSYLQRAIGEVFLPFFLAVNFIRSPLVNEKWEGIIWYSPSIFLAPFVWLLKLRMKCRTYLIVRDIFPQWAVDVGLMRRGIAFFLLQSIANFQMIVADVVGVQSANNLPRFNVAMRSKRKRLEVLNNWLASPEAVRSDFRISNTPLRGKKIFVYIGNVGPAQAADIFLQVASEFAEESTYGFLFVGRGRDFERLSRSASLLGLANVLFHDEIPPDEIPDLLSQCHVGLVSLDRRHSTHNVPGKFLAYMRSGLPVVACVNEGNDLFEIIKVWRVGFVTATEDTAEIRSGLQQAVKMLEADVSVRSRCRLLFSKHFGVHDAVTQVLCSLRNR